MDRNEKTKEKEKKYKRKDLSFTWYSPGSKTLQGWTLGKLEYLLETFSSDSKTFYTADIQKEYASLSQWDNHCMSIQ